MSVGWMESAKFGDCYQICLTLEECRIMQWGQTLKKWVYYIDNSSSQRFKHKPLETCLDSNNYNRNNTVYSGERKLNEAIITVVF